MKLLPALTLLALCVGCRQYRTEVYRNCGCQLVSNAVITATLEPTNITISTQQELVPVLHGGKWVVTNQFIKERGLTNVLEVPPGWYDTWYGATNSVITNAVVNIRFGPPKTHWPSEDAARHEKWRAAKVAMRQAEYDLWASTNTARYAIGISPAHEFGNTEYISIDTYNYRLGFGENTYTVEIGFRDDGVVVWRKKK